MTRENSGRDIGIDVLKCLCALFVVMIHAPFRIHLGPYTVALARVAVPVFFVITGYYFPRMQEKGRTAGHLRKLAWLTLGSCVFYFLFHVLYQNPHPQRYLLNFTHTDTLIHFFCFNACPVEGHLWYFFALLYAIPVLALLHRFRAMKYLFYTIPILLVANYLLTYAGHYEYYRNWALTALPYMGIGVFIRQHAGVIVSRLPRTWILILCYVVLCALLYVEWDCYYRHHAVAYRDDYLCTPWMTLCLFLIAIRPHDSNRLSTKLRPMTAAIAFIGRKYSPYIYIFHIAVKNSFHFWKHWKTVYTIYPLWIFGFTLLLCAVGTGLISFVRNRMRRCRILSSKR